MANLLCYCIVDAVDLSQAKIDEVLETDLTTVRKSIDGTLAVLKWLPPSAGGATPPTMAAYVAHDPASPGGVGTYTHTEVRAVMVTAAWDELPDP